MPLRRPQRGDAGDDRRLARLEPPYAEGELVRVHAAMDDVDLRPAATGALEQEALVEVRDRHDERGVRCLACKHRLMDEEVVRVRREAVRHAGEAPRDPGGQRGVRREVRVDVLDALVLETTRVGGGQRDRRERAREHARDARVFACHHADDRQRPPRTPHQPPRERRGPRSGTCPPQPLAPRLRSRVHDGLALRGEQGMQQDIDVGRSGDGVELAQHERLRDGREARHQVGDPHRRRSSRLRRLLFARGGRSGSGRPSRIARGASVTIHSSSARACGRASAA